MLKQDGRIHADWEFLWFFSWSVNEFCNFFWQLIAEFCKFFPMTNWDISHCFLQHTNEIHYFSVSNWKILCFFFCDWLTNFTIFACDGLGNSRLFSHDQLMNFKIFSCYPFSTNFNFFLLAGWQSTNCFIYFYHDW